MAEIDLLVSSGSFVVRRPHGPESSPLRAWSAADQLVLDELGDADLGRLLIVNDEFGALSVALAASEPILWGDSALSRAAAESNAAVNGLAPIGDRVVHGDDVPTGRFDTVIMRVPKTSALLLYQLAGISGLVDAESTVIGAGMAKHVHRSTLDAFENLIGPTTTSRAVRKARLIYGDPTGVALPQPTAPHFEAPDGTKIAQAPGTFSADHVDVGTALLLDVLASQPVQSANVVDVGCGNGVIAASLARRWPESGFVLTDVSDLAIAAAKATWQLNNLGAERADFVAADGTSTLESASADIVVTNPPFHQGHALDSDMTDAVLADIARILRPDGVGYVVAQRHLNLHTRMRRWFSSVQVRSGHPSHVVVEVAP